MIKIRKATKKDIIPASDLVIKTFVKFNSKEGTKRGVQEYMNHHDPKKNLDQIKQQFPKYKIFLVAEDRKKIIGIIRGSESRIGNLFVAGKYHKKGIAQKLIKRFEKIAKKRGSNKIKVRSSLYASGFYLKNGYKKTTGITKMHGLKLQPMTKRLK